MTKTDFITHLRTHFNDVSDAILSDLRAGEDLIMNLDAENSLYLRLNGNKVRQNTNVEQVIVSLKLLKDGRTIESSTTLTGDASTDKAKLARLLATGRQHASALPIDPHQVAAANNGTSREEFRSELPSAEAVIESIVGSAQGTDLVGFYCGGPVISANRNSKGQNHWFASETFFMDYSVYDGPRAAKSVYAGAKWNQEDWAVNLARANQQLALLSRPTQNVKPGKYRTYLAPGAVSELLSMFGWGALSAAAWKQGRSAFKRLADGEAKLSPLFTLKENFSMGLTPRFNSLGEVAAESLTLIEKGELKELLVSSRTAKEHGLKSNAAAEYEGPRSPDVLPGSLEEKDTLRELGTGLYLSNLHYLNWSDPTAARITGMTRYACFWVENGEVVGPIKDLRFDESLYEALGEKLVALTKKTEIDPSVSTYHARALGGRRIPGMLINDFTFTL